MPNFPAMNPSTSAAAHSQPSSSVPANRNLFSKVRSIFSGFTGCRRNHAVISSRSPIQLSSPSFSSPSFSSPSFSSPSEDISLNHLGASNDPNNLTGRVARLERTAQNHTTEINEINENIADQGSGIIKLLADFHRHEGMNADKWSNQSRTNQGLQEIQEIQEIQEKLETELNTCNNDINEVARKFIGKLTRGFDRVKIDIDTLRPHVRTNTDRTFKNRLDTLNTKISTLFTPIGQSIWTGERDISKLTRNVDTIYKRLDQDINKFKQELNSIVRSLNRSGNAAGQINDKDQSALAFIRDLSVRLEDSKQTLDFVKSLYTRFRSFYYAIIFKTAALSSFRSFFTIFERLCCCLTPQISPIHVSG